MNEQDTVGAVWGLGGMVILLVLLGMILWSALAVWRTKATLTREAEYHKLAERGTEAQEVVGQRLSEVIAQLASVQGRLDAIEIVLKEVELPENDGLPSGNSTAHPVEGAEPTPKACLSLVSTVA
jgi:hypothetical protein